LHAHPELQFDVHRTAGVVEAKLRDFGVDEVITGIGKTGVVGVIHGKNGGGGKILGLRADMDALPIQEAYDHGYKSTVDGKMHACGHDGHTAMLLGAARYLSETRQFDGTVIVIFQPAEEGGGGGKEMVDDGLMDRFGIQEVYGMHNFPGIPVGQFGIRPGPLMAAADTFQIDIEGKGGHAAKPHGCIDPAIVVAQLVSGLQTIASRNINPQDSLVISVTQIHMGDTDNVIPQTAMMGGTVRTFSEEVRLLAKKRMTTLCEHLSLAHEANATLKYSDGYPVTINHTENTAFAASVAATVVGESNVDTDTRRMMGAEDFSYMLNARPGAFIFIGQGDTAGLHHPEYDFNDEIIPIGCSYWVKLVETAMPVG
jgi:hippurate hydrolase